MAPSITRREHGRFSMAIPRRLRVSFIELAPCQGYSCSPGRNHVRLPKAGWKGGHVYARNEGEIDDADVPVPCSRTPGHNSRYISSEASRLTRIGAPVRPSGEV